MSLPYYLRLCFFLQGESHVDPITPLEEVVISTKLLEVAHGRVSTNSLVLSYGLAAYAWGEEADDHAVNAALRALYSHERHANIAQTLLGRYEVPAVSKLFVFECQDGAYEAPVGLIALTRVFERVPSQLEVSVDVVREVMEGVYSNGALSSVAASKLLGVLGVRDKRLYRLFIVD